MKRDTIEENPAWSSSLPLMWVTFSAFWLHHCLVNLNVLGLFWIKNVCYTNAIPEKNFFDFEKKNTRWRTPWTQIRLLLLQKSDLDFYFFNYIGWERADDSCQEWWEKGKPFACLVIFHAFVVCWHFLKFTFSKNSLRNTTRVSNSFDPDQDRRSVGPDLGPNC